LLRSNRRGQDELDATTEECSEEEAGKWSLALSHSQRPPKMSRYTWPTKSPQDSLGTEVY
jgi:hypothetical protein